ncbi:MAG: PqqD family protein [Alphaproteobacteria bacterium]|nr:PqqD family protein [Alphaproteobacteria bacterium]
MNETNPRYCKNPAVSTTPVENDLFLVEPEGQDVYYLDAVTSGIWRLLDQPATWEEILTTYAEAFPDQEIAALTRDLRAALDDMVTHRLVLIAPETPPRAS